MNHLQEQIIPASQPDQLAVVSQQEKREMMNEFRIDPIKGLIPTNFAQLNVLATMMVRSGMMPKGIDRPEQVLVACQMGFETAIQNKKNDA